MRKKRLLIIGIIILSIIIGGVLVANNGNFQINSKIGKVERILEQHKNGKIETSVAIEEMRKIKDSIEDKESKDKIQEEMSILSKYHNGKMVLEETRDAINNNIIKKNGYGKQGKEYYVAKIERYIDENSELYQEAQDVLSQIEGYKQKYINVTYSKEKTTAGLQKVRIKIENESGKDINYIRLDFFEKNKDGYISNSGWTNTSKTIKNNSSVNIETYHDFTGSETTLEFEISDIRYAN